MTLSIGILSGTSADGIDAAVVESAATRPRIVSARTYSYSKEISAMLRNPSALSVEETAFLNRRIAEEFAVATMKLLKSARISSDEISVIGSHGQTIFHLPGFSSLQIGSPAVIAKLTGIPVAADFRMDDIALGGQGAPLVPLLDRLLLGNASKSKRIAALNLGGISNVTILQKNEILAAFDIGPANSLIDAACRRLLNIDFDKNGEIAASGKFHAKWLAKAFKHPFFKQCPPKSTGIESFGEPWLIKSGCFRVIKKPNDVIATLSELTAKTIADALETYKLDELHVSGGGLKNNFVMERLRAHLPKVSILPFSADGIDPDFKEAVLFAHLGCLRMNEAPCDLRRITGSKRPVPLGGLWMP